MTKKLYRNSSEGSIGGVCTGLGEYFDLDKVLIRVAFIIAAFFSIGILVYIVMWIVVPDKKNLFK